MTITPQCIRALHRWALSHDIPSGLTSLSWGAPADPGGDATLVYDTLRSADAADFVTGAVCVESDDALDTAATDSTPAAVGQTLYYLVRPENACVGTGGLGTDSAGVARTGTACP